MRLYVRPPFAVLASILLALSACSKSTEGPVPTTVAVTPSTPLSLVSVNQTAQLAAAVLDQNGNAVTPAPTITWSSSNAARATVSATGLVTAKANGTATISATSGSIHGDVGVTVAQVPTNATKQGDAQSAAPSAALPNPITAHVTDAGGSPVPGVTVTFAVTSGGGSVAPPSAATDASGNASTSWTLGAAGAQAMSATIPSVGALSFSATAVVAGALSRAIIAAGNGQVAMAGQPLAQPIQVQALDAIGTPVSGASVTFAVATGGGSITPLITTTNGSGIASATWTVGNATTIQKATATVASLAPLTFSGNGVPATAAGFQVIVVNIGPAFNAQVQVAFDSAVAFWQRAITGDLPDFASITIPANQCNNTGAIGPIMIDDVIILATFDSIDGPSNILGQAGPCAFIRSSGAPALSGTMKFDTADVASMINNGTINTVIRHEMGHVLGFGTLWTQTRFNCLQSPSSAGNALDTFFSCPLAQAAFTAIGGSSYTGGAKVPVENCGPGTPPSCGAGTFNGHWRELVFHSEAMTGFIGPGNVNPMSRLTIGAMEDLGFVVDYSASETYNQIFTAPPASFQLIPQVIDLHDDVIHRPLVEIDSRGRPTGVVVRP